MAKPDMRAFPRAVDGQPGMTLAQFFAAHAPEQVADWFVGPAPVFPERPDPEQFFKIDAEVRMARDWTRDPCYDLEAAFADAGHVTPVAPFTEAMEQYWTARAKAEDTVAEAKYFAWRAYYGRRMAEEVTK